MTFTETESFEVEAVKRETDLSITVTIDGEDYCIPKSQIHADSECYSIKSGPGTLIISRWLAKERRLV
jgi:hypothetical protein